ncbi:putative oxidoreductase [Escovopsis weberi]|uniref:Putative oxidoreductase n=1 Tax=Escovopsis weberi TaxID=150374 RepID=A0A0M8N7I5_ESCWE|nr:putative oxidoreductase [Escovopsis weberi]
MGGGHRAGLPTPHSTKSFWQTEPSELLTGHRTTQDLPAKADVVIIGSGITGAFAARELVARSKNVLMLEAREACWGATSRNGGHCQPIIYSTAPPLARFEVECFHQIRELIEEHNIPCDWHVVGGVHALPTQELVDLAAKSLQRLRRDHPDLADKAALYTEKPDLEALRLVNARGAVVQSHAAKCWPYKLVAWILEALIAENPAARFNLQTWTPVTQLQRSEGSGAWEVWTARGNVVADQVLLATNAYTSHLVPAFADLIVPVRGQVAALETPEGNVPLEHSHVWLPGRSDNYLIERDGPVGPIIVGGERLSVPPGGEGVWKDDTIDEEVARLLRRSLHLALKLRPAGQYEEEELKADFEWTGIMGYSKDGYPWVGPVPSQLCGGAGLRAENHGLWVCAAYTGHGMPLAARCAVGVAGMMTGEETGVTIPGEFLMTPERAERAKGLELKGASVVDDLRDLLRDVFEN